jgi:hypothetical protein
LSLAVTNTSPIGAHGPDRRGGGDRAHHQIDEIMVALGRTGKNESGIPHQRRRETPAIVSYIVGEHDGKDRMEGGQLHEALRIGIADDMRRAFAQTQKILDMETMVSPR